MGHEPGDQVGALADVLPNARLTVAARQTHMVKPKLLAPQLAEFYASANGGGQLRPSPPVPASGMNGARSS
jgi:hypothetical protein